MGTVNLQWFPFKPFTDQIDEVIGESRNISEGEVLDLSPFVELRRAQNQIRAVTKSRQNWEQRAGAAEAELDQLKKLNVSGT